MDRLDLSRDVRARLSELSRRNGETEDRLLRRLLGLAGKDPGSGSATPINAGSGFEDATYAILFPEGFEISRTYKGRPYAARVVRGRWRLAAGRTTRSSMCCCFNRSLACPASGNCRPSCDSDSHARRAGALRRF